MKKSILISFVVALILSFSVSAAPVWQSLGSQTVTRHAESDRISVRHKGQFSKIQLAVAGTGVNMKRMVVVYKNGQRHEVKLNSYLKRDSKTRVIDLPGKSRAISHVNFWYEAKGLGRKKAIITLFGRR